MISQDGQYRYWLSREWDPRGPQVCWMMLNPSTADADVDDPTIRRCVDFSQRWGFGGLMVVNLYALRSTDPSGLLDHPNPEGPRNKMYWSHFMEDFDLHVAAWGAGFDSIEKRIGHTFYYDRYFEENVEDPIFCLGTTKSGQPRHPLFVPANTPLEPFRA